jgi:hypothetical protein
VRARRCPVLTATLVASLSTGAARADKLERDDLAGPPLEVAKDPTKVDPPPVPGFELPAVEPGFHSPRELRVRGRALLGTEVKVKGYVTWIYDCAAALAVANPRATRAQIAASIDKNPALCEPAKLYLGDRKDTARDVSLWVVDAPGPGKGKPGKPAAKLAVGDFVTVTGTWDVQSPHHEHNGDGLLIFAAVDRAKPGPTAAPTPAAATPPGPAPDIEVVSQAPPRPSFDAAARAQSISRLNACNQAFAARQYDTAINECRAATQMWPGNHLAWYVGASAHMAKNEWAQARADTEAAVTRRPDQAMYQLYHGIALYEAERARVRDDIAAREHKKPEEVAINPAQLKLDAARDALLRAVKLGPALWRAHFYLGRVYRDLDDARHAAEQLSYTIATHPAYRFGYLALGELERRWGFNDDAIAIAVLGTKNVPADEAGELWLDAGMAYDANHADDQAIDAFGKAIAARPDDATAKLARGQIYFRKGDFASAKRDLDDVIASADPRIAAMRPLAAQMLAQIARRR